MLRAGLYARVSTNDLQTLAMQNRAMREYGCLMIAARPHGPSFGEGGSVQRQKTMGHLVASRRSPQPPEGHL